MKPRILVLLAAGLLVAADPPKENLLKEETAKLQGTWTVVSQTAERVLPEGHRVQKIVFQGNKVTLVYKNLNRVCEFTVDPTKDPKQIDRTIAEGQFKGTVLPGIYQLDGDELKYCYDAGHRGPARTVRPKEFKGDFIIAGTTLLVLKREKP